jgi:hypothetical protein
MECNSDHAVSEGMRERKDDKTTLHRGAMRGQRKYDDSPGRYISRPWSVEYWRQDIFKSFRLFSTVHFVDDGNMVFEVNARDPFISWLFGMFVLDDHAQVCSVSKVK